MPNYASGGRWLWLKPVYTVLGLTCSAPGNCGCAYCGRLVSQDENFPGAESSVSIDSSRCEWNCTKFQENWPKKFHIIRVIPVNFVSLISYSFSSFFFFQTFCFFLVLRRSAFPYFSCFFAPPLSFHFLLYFLLFPCYFLPILTCS